jgi:kynurenine 3-monooxygenase
MAPEERSLVIVGGGPAGSLLAILLAKRGLEPTVIERRTRRSDTGRAEGRSINLALAARGIAALRAADVYRDVEPLLIPMRGRMVHAADEPMRFLPYGQTPAEQIYSLSRSALNETLYELAQRRYGVEYLFGQRCTDVDAAARCLRTESSAGRSAIRFDVAIGADGAGSAVRRALQARDVVHASESLLDHGYKELSIPPAPNGDFALEPNALHIWPRGDFMLIALPNTDRSFTATLFLPLAGALSFERIAADGAAGFFSRHFPSARALMPRLEEEFAENPIGSLGTVSCTPWSDGAGVLLLGDAAHAIVPFHGQGMNAAFEDCRCIDRLLETHGPRWDRVFAAFEAERRDDTAAIAEMALENYAEMRDRVRDPKFQLRAELAFELERRHPAHFVPRYSMVMFHPEIGYREAQRRGRVQQQILEHLTGDATRLSGIDFELARRLIEARL